MIEPTGVFQDDATPCTDNPRDDNSKSNDSVNEVIQNNTATLDDSLLEKTFELVTAATELEMDEDKGRHDTGTASREDANDIANEKPRSNSDTRGNNVHNKMKKSGSFLSKLQATSTDKEASTIPSSIASALSSFSSFTSNFTLNSTTPDVANNTASSLTIETASTSTRLSQIVESKEDIFYKKAAIERKNLINLTKLIVKDLISSSISSSRTIDDDQNTIHLNNYFTLIDRVLKHGLKQNILSNRSASLWTALDSLPRYLKESTLMSESVRSLANTKTPDGKIKAWMRLAMMQKKLPEYFNELLANKDVLLKDIYHEYAFMLNDEAQVFAGLIIGINVIDCNFFVKDANFDLMDDIIDLSPYLKAANCFDGDDQIIEHVNDGGSEVEENITAILNQKNYLEEWNKRLEATISDLQAKIRVVEEQNSKLEMEAKVSEVRISKLQGKRGDDLIDKQGHSSMISDAFKSFMSGSEVNSKQSANVVAPSMSQPKRDLSTDQVKTDELDQQPVNPDQANDAKEPDQQEAKSDTVLETNSTSSNQAILNHDAELKQKLNDQEKELSSLKERAGILEASYRSSLERIKTLERDLDVQTSMNADKETTIKMYEKDIRDKQAQVESLRASLVDSKKMNSDLNEKFNDTNTKLKDRIKIVSALQENLDKWKLENRTLATKLQDKQIAFKSVTVDLEKAVASIADLRKYNEKINEELRKERESGQSSTETLETQAAQITELTEKLNRLEMELDDAKPFKDTTNELTKRCREYEQSLEEIGAQLRESRLEAENLKENSAVFLDSQWMDSKAVKSCVLCEQSFSVTRRKHHCRLCGNVFCQMCSDNKMELASSAKPVRVCDTCHSFLLAKFVKNSST